MSDHGNDVDDVTMNTLVNQSVPSIITPCLCLTRCRWLNKSLLKNTVIEHLYIAGLRDLPTLTFTSILNTIEVLY